jgi:hypothetical protein
LTIMIKVNVTAVNNVAIQDPRPGMSEQLVWEVAAGTTKSIIMDDGQLERLAPVLDRMAADGAISYILAPAETYIRDGVTYDLPAYAEQPGSDSDPAIDSTTAIAVGGGSATVVVNNLLGAQTFATARLITDEDPTASWMNIVALNAGTSGNDISVKITNVGNGGLAVTYANSIVDINLGGASRALSAVVAAFNITMAGVAKSVAYGNGAKLFTTALAAVSLSGGLGTGYSVTLGGAACVVTDVTGTFNVTTNVYTPTGSPVVTLTVTTPSLGTAATGSNVMLQVRSDNRVTNVGVPVTLTAPRIEIVHKAAVDVNTPAAIPCVVTGLSVASALITGAAAAGYVRLTAEVIGSGGSDMYALEVIAGAQGSDPTCAKATADGITTFTVSLSTTAGENTMTKIAAAINAEASANTVLATVIGTGSTQTATLISPTMFSSAYGGPLTMTIASAAATSVSVVPLTAATNLWLVTGTNADVSAAPLSGITGEFCNIHITAGGQTATATVATTA